MGNIRDLLNKIRYATYGKEVRQSIHDAIEECYATASVDHDNANMEVKIARGTHNTLNDRLDENEKKQENLSSQLEQKANKNEVGSPLTATSIAEMIDKTKVYVNTIDGNWYSWNGTTWAIGGVYNSQGIGNESLTTEKYGIASITPEKTNFSNSEIITPTWIDGKYINSSGSVASLDGWGYSEPISLKKNEGILFVGKGSSTNVSMISKKLPDSYLPKVISKDSNTRYYSYYTNEDCEVVLCTKLSDFSYAIKFDDIKNILNDLKKSSEEIVSKIDCLCIEGKYIGTDGGIKTLSLYKYSQPIKLKYCETLEFIGYGTDAVSCVSKCDENGTNIKPLFKGNNNLSNYSYTNTSSTDIYIIACGDTRQDFIVKIKKNIDLIIKEIKNIKDTNESLYINNNKYFIDYTPLFSNVVSIGDSLTRGYQSQYPEGERNRDFSYPLALSKLCNWNYKNYGISGSTPTSWFETKKNTDFSNFDCAIICLGRNGGLSLEEDRNNYKNIIDKLRSDNEHITIFTCSVPPADYNNNLEVNSYIQTISNEKNTWYLDIYNDNLLENEGYRMDSCHFYSLGYLTLANIIKNQINKCIADNLDEFMSLWSDKTLPDIIS